ncbi:MAG: ABC transporter, permease protein [Rhodanobacteraceae bacterium]|jgi:putative ABC transport system permease protein|nr:MAG: ABC transporter, permease protein [Rhodanobacteraceae bacterium]
MDIQPIFAALRKHRIPAALIVLEIALACAVLCNAVFMIGQRIGEIRSPNAIDEQGIVDINVQGINPDTANADIPRDLATLREMPGVSAVAALNMMPLGNNSWNMNAATSPDQLQSKDTPNVAEYLFTRGGPDALGLHLLQGRFFNDDEYADSKLGSNYLPDAHAALVTQSLVRRLWPDGNALGKSLWIGKNNRYTVVGIVADVLRPDTNGGENAHFLSAFFPVSPAAGMQDYVVRSASQDRERIVRDGVQKLETLSPSVVVEGHSFTEIRDKYYANARSMVWMLVLVCVVMLAVTAFGIVGLTSFWVGQRRRQIGIRRAVGATRAHILRYFQTENFLLSSAGVAVGMILAFGINLYLMQHYQTTRLPWYYLPVSAIALWLLGQLAVLGPALRAANVPPVVATRDG